MNRLYSEGRRLFTLAQLRWDNTNFDIVCVTSVFDPLDDFYADLSGVVGSPIAIAGKTVDSDGRCRANNFSFGALSGGGTVVAMVIRQNGGSQALITYIDSGFSGLPFVADGSIVNVEWPAHGIFIL